MTYRVLRDMGGYEGMHFVEAPGSDGSTPRDFATAEEAIKFALADTWGRPVHVVKMVEFEEKRAKGRIRVRRAA